MRQRRWIRWGLGALGGMAALVATTAGTMGCGGRHETAIGPVMEQTIVLAVVTNRDARVRGVQVTAWIVDVDSDDKVPVVAGTALTDAEGVVEFKYMALNPPYVCGYEVREPTSDKVLAHVRAEASNDFGGSEGEMVKVALP